MKSPLVQKRQGIHDLVPEPLNCGAAERQIIEGRGPHRFLQRGLERVNGECNLIAARHNLRMLYWYWRAITPAGAGGRKGIKEVSLGESGQG